MFLETISSQECLVIFAYLNYLKTLNGKLNRQSPGVEHVKPANRKLPRPEKPHRQERAPRPLKTPKYTLKELVDQITENNVRCNPVKAAKLKQQRPEKPHRQERAPRPLKTPKYTLKELVDQITENNVHEEVDTGPAVGNEVWWD